MDIFDDCEVASLPNISKCCLFAPSSDHFSKNVFDAWSYGGVAFLFFPPALTVAAMVLFAEEIHHVQLKSNSKQLKNALLWIMSAYSAIMTIGVIGVFVPRAVVEVGFMYNIYEAYCIYKYYYLIIVFAGGTKPFVEKSSTTPMKLNLFPISCMVCLPRIYNTSRATELMKWLILQYVVITPLCGAIAVVLRADGNYYKLPGEVSPSVYISLLSALSTLVCIYGVKLLYKFTVSIEGMQETHAIRGKTLCMQLTMFVVGFESFIFNLIAQLDGFPCTYPLNFLSRRRVIYNYCVVMQMFFLAFLSRYYFRRSQDIRRQVILHDDLTLAVDYTGVSCERSDATLQRPTEHDQIVIETRQSYNGVSTSPSMIKYSSQTGKADIVNRSETSLSGTSSSESASTDRSESEKQNGFNIPFGSDSTTI